jgi:hypothetical protein
MFHKYSEFHAVDTRHKHEPVADVTIYQKEYSILGKKLARDRHATHTPKWTDKAEH